MVKRYKEVIFGLLLGLAMWPADALMHVLMSPADVPPPSFAEELLHPDAPMLFVRLLFTGLAALVGWLLWRSNRREREVRDLESRVAALHERMVGPASLILDLCNALIRGGGLTGEKLEIILQIRGQARQVDDFAKDFPFRLPPEGRPAGGSERGAEAGEESP
jgi:hypothetical protein